MLAPQPQMTEGRHRGHGGHVDLPWPSNPEWEWKQHTRPTNGHWKKKCSIKDTVRWCCVCPGLGCGLRESWASVKGENSVWSLCIFTSYPVNWGLILTKREVTVERQAESVLASFIASMSKQFILKRGKPEFRRCTVVFLFVFFPFLDILQVYFVHLLDQSSRPSPLAVQSGIRRKSGRG